MTTQFAIIRKFEIFGSVADSQGPVRPRSARTHENMARVREHVAEIPSTLVHRRSQQLDILEEGIMQIV